MPWMAPEWHYSIDTGYANYNALLAVSETVFELSEFDRFYTWSKSLDNSSGWFEAENGTGGGRWCKTTSIRAMPMASRRTTCGTTFRGARSIRSRSGRARIGSRRGFASYVLGGWKANYLFQIRSGQPYT